MTGDRVADPATALPITIAERGHQLPTVAGCVSGIVARETTVCTVQCSVCLRTATGKPIFATGWALFVPDDGERGRPQYRRCRDCRSARLHPQLELWEAA